MRWNTPHNFLGGGRLFFYRDIFSGLSNETTGAASYTFPTMDPAVHQLINTVNCYQRLLLRYASIIVKNKLVASLIVEDVLETYTHQVKIIPPSETRSFLTTCTSEKCAQWLAAKPQVFNQRKPKNPT